MKILFLQNRVLFPADTGGKIRTLNVLRHLAQWQEVAYACPVGAADRLGIEQMRALGLRVQTVPAGPVVTREQFGFYSQIARNLCSRFPLSVDRTYDRRLRDLAAKLLADEPFDLVVCDFVQTARHAIGAGAAAKLLFQHNVEAQILQRHAQRSGGVLRRAYLRMQYRRMRRFEASAGAAFDTVIAVSEQDAETFRRDYGWSHVVPIDTAVDLTYFTPTDETDQPGRVLFLGSMDWMPNQEGVRYFVEQVWPAIRREAPDAVFQIVGRRPPSSIQKLEAVDGVHVIGTVPDVRPYLASAAVVVVPLLVGGGTRLKIFEAMAMAKAVVSTTIGAEGLPVAPSEHFLLADDAHRFAGAVLQLLRSPADRVRLGRDAHRFVSAHSGAEAVARQFERACLQAVSLGRTRRGAAWAIPTAHLATAAGA
jgi:polysaccharide biosynthesis protein PslH